MVIRTDHTLKLLPLQSPIPGHPIATSSLQGQPWHCAVVLPVRVGMFYQPLQPTASSPTQQPGSGVSIASGTENQSLFNFHFLLARHFLGVAMVLRNTMLIVAGSLPTSSLQR